MSSADQPEVAWKAIEADAQVFSTEGESVGKVAEVVGDHDADVFTGLAISLRGLGPKRFVEAERIRGIWPNRVELELTKDEVERLPEHTAPPVIRVDPTEGGGFFRRLFGR